MKHKNDSKDWSALSLEAGHVTVVGRPAITDTPSSPRPVRDAIRNLNVQPEGAANGDWSDNDGAATTRHWPKKVIMLFSNDPGFQVSVRQALPQQVELMPIRHVEQAIRLAHENYIDAALLDLALEDGNGWRTAEQLLADDAAIRLLLAVKTNGRSDLTASVNAGLLLEKPVHAAQLVEMLDCLLRKSNHERFRHNVGLQSFLRYTHPLSWTSGTISRPRHRTERMNTRNMKGDSS